MADPTETCMARCIQLAALGRGTVGTNPMVGCVIQQGGRIIAEGWHQAQGEAHAEVMALRQFGSGPLPAEAVVFVNLEPCTHYGRTPPCADLLIERNVRNLVVACEDPDPRVAGNGIEILRNTGCMVQVGVLRKEARWLNRTFITAHELQRPYVILKWAQSRDGFIDSSVATTGDRFRISTSTTDTLVHQWRAEVDAILIGSRTAIHDDPRLTTRMVNGRDPLRVLLDRKGQVPADRKLFDPVAETLVFGSERRELGDVDQVILQERADPIPAMLSALMDRSKHSVLVEGGAELLGHFLRTGIWDEVRVIKGDVSAGDGTPAPTLDRAPDKSFSSGRDRIEVHFAPAWSPA